MTRLRTTFAMTALAGVVLATVGAPASALSLSGTVTSTTSTVTTVLSPAEEVSNDALAAVAGAPDWGEAVASYLTGTLDGSYEPQRYSDPFLLEWSSFLPSYPGVGYSPSTEDDCTRGSIQCVEKVIRQMTKRYERLGCDHNAAFALTYLLTTEEYERYWRTGAFDDPAWLNHYDAVFAQFYFDAIDDWYVGSGAATPPAWRIAFESADARDVSGLGDVLLGMNGHIRRDLPFVLEAIGLRNADGTTRKADHDRVTRFLNEVTTYVLDEVARRHDPSMSSGVDVPYTTLDSSAFLHIIMEWREQAWRQAEMLLSAPTQADRDRIAAGIENETAATAIAIRTLFAQADPTTRDAHCASWLASR